MSTLHCVLITCLPSLLWSEHTLWLHSCRSTGHRCVTRQSRALPFIYLWHMQRPLVCCIWLSQWSTVAAVCSLSGSARPLSSRFQSYPGLWCVGSFVNESSFHQLSLKIGERLSTSPHFLKVKKLKMTEERVWVKIGISLFSFSRVIEGKWSWQKLLIREF